MVAHLSPGSFERPGGGGDHTRAHHTLRPWPATSAYGFLASDRQEIGGGGGLWQIDDDWMDIGGRSTSTPAAGTGAAAGGGGGGGGPGGQQEGHQEIDGFIGEDNGGAAEEMDQDGSGGGGLSGRVYPAGWETKTKDQKRKYWKRRRPSGKGQSGP